MIYGFFGSIPGCPHDRQNHAIRGNGKTLCLTFVGYLDHLDGRTVISNYKTTFSEFVGTEEIVEMINKKNLKDTTILLSELQVYMNSLGTKHSTIKSFVGNVVGQSRKRNVDIHYDTQRYGDIHPRIRVQTDRTFIPRKYHRDGTPCNIDRCNQKHLIYLYQHDPYLDDPVMILNAETVGKLYNTNDIVTI